MGGDPEVPTCLSPQSVRHKPGLGVCEPLVKVECRAAPFPGAMSNQTTSGTLHQSCRFDAAFDKFLGTCNCDTCSHRPVASLEVQDLSCGDCRRWVKAKTSPRLDRKQSSFAGDVVGCVARCQLLSE